MGWYLIVPLASLVQLVERRSPKPDVEGSSPSGRDLNKKRNIMANQTKDKIDVKEAMTAYFKSVKLETPPKKIITYFKGLRTEWGKITWPEKNQVVVETFFVVAIVFTFTVFIYVVDKIFDFGVHNIESWIRAIH